MDKTNLVIAFLVAAILAGLFVRYGVSLPFPRESFMQKEVGMPLNAKGMGPYDEVSIAGASGWAASEPLPVATAPANMPIDSNKLMLLADNKVSSDCCPSAFNTDTGCVCLTEHDRVLFASRGGNKA
jgi:hypothetical protein